MSQYQKEIPQTRVNITLDLQTEGARKKTELPLSLLILGDFSQGKTKGNIAERNKINIQKDNLNKVMADMLPELNFMVNYKVPKSHIKQLSENEKELNVHLKLDSIQAFHPEKIVQQVPELRKLLAMRNLLKDLRSNIIDNTQFRKELEKITKEKSALLNLQRELTLTTEGGSL